MSEEKKELAREITKKYEARVEKRKKCEEQWKQNINFLEGEHYQGLQRSFSWEERGVYNHIAPIVETRLSKFGKIRPKLSARPNSFLARDIKKVECVRSILNSVQYKRNLNKTVSEATKYSETMGTVFYKVLWNSEGGDVVGQDENGEKIYSGDVDILVVSPFELYPENFEANTIEEQKSIIHARSVSHQDVKHMWGVEVKEDSESSITVLEYYEAPTTEHINGRLVIVAGEEVLYDGELPYINQEDEKRGFPFVRQVCLESLTGFYGTTIIERCIPVQKAYNAVKNRKHEFLNRISFGVLLVEDGSVDIENLEDEGLTPGKVLVYRQGSIKPEMLTPENVPSGFETEEAALLTEFMFISGVSDLMRSSKILSASSTSGVVVKLLAEQDESRLLATVEQIKFSMLGVAKHVIRLYKQFQETQKRLVMYEGGDTAKPKEFFFTNKDIVDIDVCFEIEAEATQSKAEKKALLFDLIKLGIFNDEGGNLSQDIKEKILNMFEIF
ncbi:MAG: hypothetical protein FWD89_02175 [Firmicutes bacterium]|nr:hypothetical protein [Bacillota bacterium]